ncbi:MAG: U32 family peptidase [Campylobacterales bacterium]|nr:U32 family peptidase [Campylobacterales bacterium]
MTANKAELLSPAGDPEKFRVALEYGADAVYGGVSHFSLRIRSGKEFDLESFGEAIEYAHARGKKVYATVNGFPFNSQLSLVEKHLAALAELKPDAFIVSTPGVIKLAKKVAPNIGIHLSTQANVLNYMDAEAYADMGVTRIIAARECSMKDLEGIKKHLPHIELEIFVHGSMCFAYSGRCLVSSLQMGRVPNRGSCANDCRMPYEVFVENPEHKTLMRLEEIPGEGTYLFNAKDLNLSQHIKEILDSGVIDSLKVEGRTKSLYYAAVTAKTYRKAIDDYYDGKFDGSYYESELNTLKNRGYTDGYIVSRPFEKDGTQNEETAMSDGEYQVKGFVPDDGLFFYCKDKIYPSDEIEILLPHGGEIAECDNDIGRVYKKENKLMVSFKKIITESEKELDSVHSGNTNKIFLPTQFPKFSFLRKKEE